jgi:hypothetical protein
MDGFESARKIMEHDRTNLIVAFSADNIARNTAQGTNVGYQGVYSKTCKNGRHQTSFCEVLFRKLIASGFYQMITAAKGKTDIRHFLELALSFPVIDVRTPLSL